MYINKTQTHQPDKFTPVPRVLSPPFQNTSAAVKAPTTANLLKCTKKLQNFTWNLICRFVHSKTTNCNFGHQKTLAMSSSKGTDRSNMHAGTGVLTQLMKSWRISSSTGNSTSSSSNNNNISTINNELTSNALSALNQSSRSSVSPVRKSVDSNRSKKSKDSYGFNHYRKYSNNSQDGNFDAMSRQQSATLRKSMNNKSNYSPLRFYNNNNSSNGNNNNNSISNCNSNVNLGTPLSANFNNIGMDSPLKNSQFELVDSNLYSTNNNNNNNSSSTFFQDLNEDWSAVIDDYNTIPIMIDSNYKPTSNQIHNGNNNINSLSRVSTQSSINYPQLPVMDHKSTEDITNERELQELNSILQRINKFDNILNNKKLINLIELRQLSWNGIPSIHRPTVWKLLIGYLPANKNRQSIFLKRKRLEYIDAINHTFSEQHKRDEPTWHQIEIDIPRTNPHIPLYQFKSVHNSLHKILYLWAIRHPASGYVQGINDLVTPFFQTFLTEYLPSDKKNDPTSTSSASTSPHSSSSSYVENTDPSTYLTDEQMLNVEADTFWCLTKLLEQITDNYIHGQPGILRQVKNLSQLVKRIDFDLYKHFQSENVEFIQFAFRWMNCLLMREFQMKTVIRMWDTYLSETSMEITTTTHSNNNNLPQTPIQQQTATFDNINNAYSTDKKENTDKVDLVQPSPTATMRSNSINTLTGLNKNTNITSNTTNKDDIKQTSLNEFHVFVCAAFLIKWSDQLSDMDFQDIITFLQNPPTKDWEESDIEMLLSEAYIWQSLYKDATSHWL